MSSTFKEEEIIDENESMNDKRELLKYVLIQKVVVKQNKMH